MSRAYQRLSLSLLAACAFGCGNDQSDRGDDAGTGGLVGAGGDPALGGTGGTVPGSGGLDATTGGTSVGTGGADPGTGSTAATTGGTNPTTGGAPPATGGAPTGGLPPATGGTEASSGCGQAAPATAPSTVDVGGQTRTFIVDVPAGYDPNTPTPIIFGFHGAGTDGEMYRSAFYGNLLSTFADEYIVVHPDALADDGGRTSWDSQGDTDLAFFDAMLALLTTTYCVDEARLFATGHSSGGFFSNVLACQRGDVLRAVGPISGGGPFTFGGASCTGQVAAWIAHGINDTTVELSNGESSRDHWAEANHCDTSQTTIPSPDYPCVEYVGCDPGYAVRWCAYDGDHNPPDFGPQGLYDFFSTL